MRGSVIALVVVTIVSLLLGFVWLPSAHSDFTAKGLWDAICRAAGVPTAWGGGDVVKAKPGTSVVLLPEMARRASSDAVGRGASLALEKCTMCHGARGVSTGGAPNLAGQYPEVIIKQLVDYKRGVTVNTISPGYIGTKMVTAIPKDVLDTKILPHIPVGRLGKPEEVAGLIIYLASEEAAFLTGANIAINGGQHMQ